MTGCACDEVVRLPEGEARAAKRSQEAAMFRRDARFRFLQLKPERNTSMKLTKNDIKQKRAELVEVLLKIEKLKADKTSLEKTLTADFEQNEAAYRNGIATENGILIRRPTWKSVAKPVVEAA